MERPRLLIPLLLLVGVLGISSAGVLIKTLEGQEAPELSVAAWRMIYGALLMAPWVLRRPRGLGRVLSEHAIALAASALLLAVHFGSFTASLYRNEVSRTVFLYSTQPVFVALGAWCFLRERPRGREWICLGVAVAGAATLALAGPGGGSGGLLGDALALLAGISLAGYVLLGRRLRRRLDLAQYTVPLYLGVGALLLVAAGLRGEALWLADGETQLLLLALAVVPTLCGHAAFSWVLRYTPSRVVSLAFLGEIPGATLLAWAALGEGLPTGWGLAGAVGCLAGVTGLAWWAREEGAG